MSYRRTFRLFRIVVQSDEEIWLIEYPVEDSDTIGDISLIVELSKLFDDELNYDEERPGGPIVVYEPADDVVSEDDPDANSAAFVICLTRPATVDDADRIEVCLRAWLKAQGEQAEIAIESPA